jgi:prefoldin subunit 5
VGKTVVTQIKQYSQAINQNIGSIQNQIDGIVTQINSLNSTMDQFSKNVIDNLVNTVLEI